MQLSIITLNYRKPSLTLACVESLYAVYNQEFITDNFEVIIVDNFSQDNSLLQIKEEIKKRRYTNCKVIASENNGGFGAGNNLGAKQAKGQIILFLNNDTQVKSGLKEMVDFLAKHDDVKILGGQLKSHDGFLQNSSGKFYTPWNLLLFLLGMQRFGLVDQSPKRISQVEWVKGALMMVKKDAFNVLGGFDENMFMYLEDMELCF